MKTIETQSREPTLKRPLHSPQKPWRPYKSGIMNLISPEDSKRALESLKEPGDLWKPKPKPRFTNKSKKSLKRKNQKFSFANSSAPGSIPELARALKHDVDLIYEWVYNNIDSYPIFGIQKGAFGSLVAGAGTPMDLSMLLIELLRESGYTADYMIGTIRLSSAEVANWLGTDNSNFNVPVFILQQGGFPLGYSQNIDGSLNEVWFTHCWVRVDISGSDYILDPSFKSYVYKSGIDYVTASGYSQSSFLTAVQSGSTVTSNYLQNLNRSNMNDELTEYTMNLIDFIKTNQPSAALSDIIGGREILPTTIPVRQAAHPNQAPWDTPVAFTTDLPTYYSCWLQISMPGLFGTVTLDSRDISGRRLTIFWDNIDRPILALDGIPIVTGLPASPSTWNPLTISVQHNAYYPNTGNNITASNFVYTQQPNVIHSAWGPSGREIIEVHREHINNARADGYAYEDEIVHGEALAMLGQTWASQYSTEIAVLDQMASSTTIMHHSVYLAQHSSSIVTGLMTVMQQICSRVNSVVEASKARLVSGLHIGPIEALAVETAASITTLAGTTLVDLANTLGMPIYDATSSNWTSDVKPNLTNYSLSDLSFIETNYINQGYRLLIPEDGHIVLNSFEGYGFLAATSTSGFLPYIIDQKGAYGSEDITEEGYVKEITENDKDPNSPHNPGDTDHPIGEPIDMVNGNFIYQYTDLTVGSSNYPFGLSFARNYSSGRKSENSGLGLGWSHNFNITARQNSDTYAGLGEKHPISAAANIVALMISMNLMVDELTTSSVRLATITMMSQWIIENLTGNAVNVQFGDNSQTFIRLPDATYYSPAAKAATLTKNLDDTYSLRSNGGVEYNFNNNGKLVSQIFPAGVTVNLTYNLDGLVEAITNNLGRTLTLTYSGNDLLAVADDSGRTVDYSYDLSGNLVGVTDTLSKTMTYAYDLPGRLTQIYRPANPLDAIITNTYDSVSRIASQVESNGQSSSYYFAGSRSEQVDPLGNSYVKYFDSDGNAIREIDALNNETKRDYDLFGRLIKAVLPEGNMTLYTYDEDHNIVSVTSKPKSGSLLADQITTFTYDSVWKKLETATDAKGETITYTYDATTGSLVKIERQPIGGVTPTIEYTHNSRGQIETVTDETGVVTKLEYALVNECLISTVVDPSNLNLITSYTHDDVGNVVTVTSAEGNVTTFVFDDARRLVQRIESSPFNYVTNFSYDENGRIVLAQRQTGDIAYPWQTVSKVYTLSGQVEVITEPGGETTTNVFDELDRPSTTTDAAGKVWEFTYDAVGRVIEIIDPNSAIYETRTFSPNGLLTSVEDANGSITTYEYDGFDRQEKVIYPDSSYEQYVYDLNGNITTTRTRAGQTITKTFDSLNRLSTKTPQGMPAQTSSYDLSGRLVTLATPIISGNPASGEYVFSFDSAGRQVTQETPDGKVVSYQFDGDSLRTKLIYPDGYYVQYNYDELGRMTDIYLNGSVTAAVHIEYNMLSQKARVTYENGCSVDYSFEQNSDLTELVHNFSSGSVTFNQNFNLHHEITDRSVSDSAFMWHPPSAATVTYGTVTSLNQYPSVDTALFSYNSNGCLVGDGTWTFGYDTISRLTSAAKSGVSVSYVYDPANRQIQKTVGSSKIRYLYDGIRRIADYDGTTDLLMSRYIYGFNLDQPLMEITAGGTKTYFHHDHLGSVVARSDAAGLLLDKYAFGPFGETDSLSGTTFGYTSQKYDVETELYYYKSRYYSPKLGRFIQPDTIGLLSGLNAYVYASNSPLNQTDTFGLAAPSADWTNSIVGYLTAAKTATDNDKQHWERGGWVTNNNGMPENHPGIPTSDTTFDNKIPVNHPPITDVYEYHQYAEGTEFRAGDKTPLDDFITAEKRGSRLWVINKTGTIFMFDPTDKDVFGSWARYRYVDGKLVPAGREQPFTRPKYGAYGTPLPYEGGGGAGGGGGGGGGGGDGGGSSSGDGGYTPGPHTAFNGDSFHEVHGEIRNFPSNKPQDGDSKHCHA